jgi:hypothetical protein
MAARSVVILSSFRAHSCFFGLSFGKRPTARDHVVVRWRGYRRITNAATTSSQQRGIRADGMTYGKGRVGEVICIVIGFAAIRRK